jgi:hypothetical protein
MRKLILGLLLLLSVHSIGEEQKPEKAMFAWTRLADPNTVGFHVYIGEDTGRYSLMVDVGYSFYITLNCLDEVFVMVRPYDKFGNEGPDSNETMYTPKAMLAPKGFTPAPRPTPSVTPTATPVGPLIILPMKTK